MSRSDPIQALRERYADSRFHVFDVQVEERGEVVVLRGRVLDESQRAALRERFSPRRVDDSGLVVLRKAAPRKISVATNLTDLHAGPGWLTELSSQVLAGQRLEVLEADERWAFARQEDGYLGWVYLPYMTDAQPLPATHIVTTPCALLAHAPGGAELAGRVLGGTRVALLEQRGEAARVAVFAEDESQPAQIPAGWLGCADLRGLDAMPEGSQRRGQMLEDAAAYQGVPYLWGGSSANGIDCSGFAQLLHRLAGIDIPRDADLQYAAGQPVEKDFLPGDLIFFGEQGATRKITHVGISLGGWEIIHSSRRRNGVHYDNVQAVEGLRETYLCAARYGEG